MTSRSARRRRDRSAWQTEKRRFHSLIERYLTYRLDRLFDLTSAGSERRRPRITLYLLVFAVLAFAGQMLLHLRSDLSTATLTDPNTLLRPALSSALQVFLVIGITAALGLHVAGRFLADIFELKDPRVAWRFVGNLSGGRNDEVLRLREGRIADEDKDSPIVQIGGPGRVFVDYDTAALFEKPDGTPHVIGCRDAAQAPRKMGPAGVLVDGFERLREPVLNLRDQYIGNPSGEPLTVSGRSLDGMPVSVTDIRGVFSIRRDTAGLEGAQSTEQPFRCRARDIESLIYKEAVPVLSSGEHPSGLPGDWTISMQALIRESLRDFMSQNRLSEFLSGVGPHEVEHAEFRNDTILTKTVQVAGEAPAPQTSHQNAEVPRFLPRTELSSKFKKYGSEFSVRAQEMGLELHWIGVGTWKMPDENTEAVISEKHLEAWRLNRENAQRSDPTALERVAEQALLERKLQLIQEIPITRHERNRSRYTDKIVLMECMLQDFWEQLGDALDVHYKNGSESAEVAKLEAAVLQVEQLLRISQLGHVLEGSVTSRVRNTPGDKAGADTPPAPASKSEAAKYQALLSKLQGDYRVAEAMIANERRRHSELTREQLISRIVERFERHGR